METMLGQNEAITKTRVGFKDQVEAILETRLGLIRGLNENEAVSFSTKTRLAW